MGDSTLGELSAPDSAALDDCPYADDYTSAPEHVSEDYVRVTQLFCDGVGMRYKDYIHSERNLEFDICSLWCARPISVLRDYCDAIKIRILWPLLFQHQRSSIISRLHPCVEATSHASEISLKKLHYVELMEEIADLAKKVVNDPFFIGGLLRIGYKIENKILVMEEALNWVKYIGDATILPKLGSVDNCWPMLSVFFTEYKYHITKVVTENSNLLEDFKIQYCMECLEQGELMKMKGNEEFSKEQFDMAIVYYTRAIEYRPENHVLYGNRALCFLRTGQIRNALGDGKRATVLKSNWTKGHYRYCDALSMLGEYDWALQANIKAQKLCKNDPEGAKDLIQQHVKLQKQIEDLQGQTPTKNPMKAFYESRAYINCASAPVYSTSLNFVEIERESSKTKCKMANGGHYDYRVMDEVFRIDDCDCQSEFLSQAGPPPKYKGKQKSRNNDFDKFSPCSQMPLPMDLKNILEKQFSKSSRAAQQSRHVPLQVRDGDFCLQDFANIMKMLRSLIQDGYTALLEQRCRSAAQAFTELLNGLDPQKIKLNLAMINYVLVVYGLAISLLGIGQPEELSEAENQFKRMIEHYPNEGLDCLAYCGIGKVYLKKNRFLEALNHFEKAKTLISRLPGVLTWPTSNVVIEETQPGKIKMLLGKFIEECRFPPVPDATCCYQKCRGYSKVQIYITDPDFKGFIRISCCQYCKIEFHMNCWKRLKTTTFNDKIDKDFLQGICLTPDCKGIISKIIIFSSGGQVKCEFEHKVIKEKVPPRPVLKQKCTSLEKLKLKEDKKLKRKIQKQEAKKLAQERMEEDLRESNAPKPEEVKEAVDSAQSCQFLDDRILQCIKQYADKIKSGILNTSKLLKELLSWKVLSTEDYTTCFSNKNFLNEAVDYVIRHLIQEKNRVKTRIFLHVLSELKEVDPKLAAWIQKLNSFGLDAAGSFFTRYGDSLKELDLSIMTFLWNEKYGDKLPSIADKQLAHFSEPSEAKEARCLIWLLEEHRERFPALHGALDEFFDIMDSRCTVLRKQDGGDLPFSSTKVKNKGKKKKQKDSKPVLVGSGATSVAPNDQTATSGGGRSRCNSNSSGPFVVPEHLRQDVEEFEALYGQQSSEHVVRSKKGWDINPKQKCSTLFDYFSQFLEEHGPLDMGNRIFSEDYQFFPEETRHILERAGGLKSFLLSCPRFVVIDNCIALRKIASRLKKRRKKTIKMKVEEMSKSGEYLLTRLPLNPSAREFTPDATASPNSEPPSATLTEEPTPEPESAACPPAAPEPGALSPPGSEDESPQQASSSSPKPTSGAAAPQRVSRSSRRNAKEAKPAYWSQTQVVTGYCTYLPFRGYGITQTPPTYINVITTLPQYTSIYTPLATVAPQCPSCSPVPAVPAYVEASTTACLSFPALGAEDVVRMDSSPSDAPADQLTTDKRGLQAPPETSKLPECSLDARDTAPPDRDDSLPEAKEAEDPEAESSEAEGPGAESLESGSSEPESPESGSPEPAGKELPSPHTKTVQVSWNTIHQEVNTDPYSPFEEQQGGMSQIEKEYHALQEQLTESCEAHEQRKLRTSEEIEDLRGQLTRSVEEHKISKTELNWFRQDLEKEMKKWQQEKRETQEKLRGLKKRMKRIVSATEKYTQGYEEKPRILESLLDQSLETSDSRGALADERAEMEDKIKTAKESYEESVRRAQAAEVSVLENWKAMEVCRLQATESHAEAYLQSLKLVSSESEADLDLESDIHSWESFLSDVRKEIEKVQLAFGEQEEAIRGGSRLSELPAVTVSTLPLPAYSTIHTQVLSESPDAEDRPPSADADLRTEAQLEAEAPGSSDVSVGSASPPPLEPEPACTGSESAQPLMTTHSGPSARPRLSPMTRHRRRRATPGRAPRSSQSPKKPFNSIMEHLSATLPSYSSTELAGFIKKVRSKNRNSLSGLSITEIVQKVTEHILEEEKKPNPGKDKTSDPGPAASEPGALSPKTRDGTVNAPAEASCELCRQAFRIRNVRELQCGHRLHKGCFKQWLRGHSGCPVCLRLAPPSAK